MLIERTRLPFTIDNVYGGFAKVNGILSIRKDILILEFQVKENVFGGLVKSRPKELNIPFGDLESVEFKKNWFVANFYVRVYRLQDVSDIPGNEDGEIKLKIKRKDREKAATMASHIALRISEIRLDMMDRED